MPWLWPILLSPFVGSFLGVLILRLPAGREIAISRSECAGCRRTLSPPDLMPVLSFLVLRGRCRTCHAPIDRFHLAIELAAILVPVWVLTVETDQGVIWADCVLGWALLTLSWIDLRHFLLPDVITLPLVLAGLAATAWLDPVSLTAHAAGAAAGYTGLRAVEIVYRRLRDRDGLGQGDSKLMAAAGAWIGWEALPSLIVGAALAGIALAVLRARRSRVPIGEAPIPFGPCIAAALWIIRLYQSAVGF